VQRNVLSDAAQRADGVAPLPERVTAKAAQKLAASAALRSNVRGLSRAARSTGSSWARRQLWRPELMNEVRLRRQAASPAAESLEAELDCIAALDLDELRALWL
jgi:hypothetical protein